MADPSRYALVLEPEAEGDFSVRIPAFPDAHTPRETVEECIADAREVIELVLWVRRDHGEEIPPSDGDAMLLIVDVPAA